MMHLASLLRFMTVAFLLNGLMASGDLSISECKGSLFGCTYFGSLTLVSKYTRADFLRSGFQSVCRYLEPMVDCVDAVTEGTNCRREFDSIYQQYDRLLNFYELLCENYREEVEKNWECLAEVLEPSVDCAISNECNFEAVRACTDRLLLSSVNCQRGDQDIVKTVVKKYITVFSHCPEVNEACHTPASHCLQAFNGLDIFQSQRILDKSFNEICSGFLNNGQCFQDLYERADCAFHPEKYFSDSYTAFVKLFTYVCQDKKAEINRDWDCLKLIGKDLIECTSLNGTSQGEHSAISCANSVVQKTTECGTRVYPLVYQLIQEKMKLFNDQKGGHA